MSEGPSNRQRKRKGPKRWVEDADEFGEPAELTDEKRKKLRSQSENYCMWMLGRSPQPAAELVKRLRLKGVPDDIIEDTLEKLASYGYVNDAEYARDYVRSRHEFSGKGASVIKQELLRKGVDVDLISEALDEHISDESEEEQARLLVQRKLRSTQRLTRQQRTNRIVGGLVRKGYSPSLAFRLVREMLSEEAEEET